MKREHLLRQLHRAWSRGLKRVLSVLLVVSLLSGTGFLSYATEEIEQRLKEARARRDQTQSELTGVQQDIDALEENREALEERRDDLNDQLYEVGNNILALNEQIVAKQQVIDETTARLEAATALKEEQFEMMKLRVQFIYEKQQYVMTDMMIQSASISDFLNQGSYIEMMSAYDREMLTQYQQTEELIALEKAQLETEMAHLQELQDEQAAEQERFYGLIVETSATIDQTNEEISAAELEAAAMRELLAQQQAEVLNWEQKLQEQLAISRDARNGVWLDASGLVFYESDLALLANLIYTEAGNQPYEGQVAVGAVVVNRMRSDRFKQNTMMEVISAPYQFAVWPTFIQRSMEQGWATESCYRAAREAMSGYSTVGNALFFCRVEIGPPDGIIIGNHIFY